MSRLHDPSEAHRWPGVRVVADDGGVEERPFVVRDCPGRAPGKREVFAALIEWEVRRSDLNRAARRRLVQYAAQLGFSGEQAGQFIRACLNRLEAELAAEDVDAAPPAAPSETLLLLKMHPARRGWRERLRDVAGPACVIAGALSLAAGAVLIVAR